jgi:hypothetical protein
MFTALSSPRSSSCWTMFGVAMAIILSAATTRPSRGPHRWRWRSGRGRQGESSPRARCGRPRSPVRRSGGPPQALRALEPPSAVDERAPQTVARPDRGFDHPLSSGSSEPGRGCGLACRPNTSFGEILVCTDAVQRNWSPTNEAGGSTDESARDARSHRLLINRRRTIRWARATPAGR